MTPSRRISILTSEVLQRCRQKVRPHFVGAVDPRMKNEETGRPSTLTCRRRINLGDEEKEGHPQAGQEDRKEDDAEKGPEEVTLRSADLLRRRLTCRLRQQPVGVGL